MVAEAALAVDWWDWALPGADFDETDFLLDPDLSPYPIRMN